jgi:hypothetical protein
VKFVKNKVTSVFGVSVEVFTFQPEDGKFTNSRLFIAHNTFSNSNSPVPGVVGGAIGIPATFKGKTSCLVVLNDTTNVKVDPSFSFYPIVLGPGTKDCLVVTRDTREDAVLNLNPTNRVITVPWW